MSKNLKQFFQNREVENTRLDSKISKINKGRWNTAEDDEDEDVGPVEPESQVVALPEPEAEEQVPVEPESQVEETK